MSYEKQKPKECPLCAGVGKKTTPEGGTFTCPACGGSGERKRVRSGMSTSYNNSQTGVAPRDEDG